MIDPKLYYLLINLGCISIPLIFSFHPWLKFYRNWKALFAGIIAMMLIFIPWDIYFTKIGVWGFNDEYISGIYLFNLPIEEWLFFICIPYACLFTYHCAKFFTKGKKLPDILHLIAWITAIICGLTAILHHDKLYTFFAHFFCCILLLYHLIIRKSNYLKLFMLTFLVLLLPFVISNGFLTGVHFWEYPFINTDVENITEKIVWYNNTENLGIRIFTMPLDDISYGLTMLLLVTTVYETFIEQN